MDRENMKIIEAMLTSFENRIVMVVTITAIVFSALVSNYLVVFFSGEQFNPSKGDQPVISYEVTYYGQQSAQVVSWLDADGNAHYAKEPAAFAGVEVKLLVMLLFNLGLIKMAYDAYRMITGKHKKRLLAQYGPRYAREINNMQ